MTCLKLRIKLNSMIDEDTLIKELSFKAIKSSGAGGQHVNKTASKIELMFDLENSNELTDVQKELLKTKLEYRLTKHAVLIMQCGESRSQFRNKSIIIQRFLELIKSHLEEEKDRIPTKIPKAVVKKRLLMKRKTAEKKANRKPPEVD